MEEKILQELFEKRSDTESQKVNEKMDNRLSELTISEKEDEIIELFRKETNNEICKKLEDLFFFYVNAKDEEALIYNEFYYKLGFADAMKMKKEIVEIVK